MEKSSVAPPADPSDPAMDGKFSNGSGLVWIEEEIPVAPASKAHVEDIYSRVWSTIIEGVPFPVKNEEAFAVARVTGMIRAAAGK